MWGMGEDTRLFRRPTFLQSCYLLVTACVVASAILGCISLQSEYKAQTRRVLLATQSFTLRTLRHNITKQVLEPQARSAQQQPAAKPAGVPLEYRQPYINGEPEYVCTHTWFHPCTAEDNRTGPPLHMIQPGKLSQEDQDMLRVLRKFQKQREEMAKRVPAKKVAFMFLTKGPLPFAPLWERFFKGFQGRYNIYIHTTPGYRFPKNTSMLFAASQIRSEKVLWGSPTMIDAERRLLGAALADPSNHRFVLLSESCIPVRGFEEVWNYLMHSNHSFVANYWTKQKVCAGRYDKHMQPEIQPHQWRKGLQWLSLTREHAVLALDDDAVYRKMEKYCRGDKWHRHCYMDEHYFPTLLHIKDGSLMANRTVTFTDFGEWSIHPKSFVAKTTNERLIRWITEPHDLNPRNKYTLPCSLNGKKRTCYLFARKFHPSALPKLMAMSRDVLGY